MKIYDSELKILRLLWDKGKMKASEIAAEMNEITGWNKNTSYTVIKRCIDKKLISRTDPGYICTAAISKKKAAGDAINEALDTYFNGSVVRFFLSLLNTRQISKFEAKEMKRILKNRDFSDDLK